MGNIDSLLKPKSEWLKKKKLYEFSDGNVWYVGDAVEGTQIFGGTGSGKTTGSGRSLAVSMLAAGMGGLVLTAKGDDLETWVGYFQAAKNDTTYDPIDDGKLVVIETGGEHTFNPLQYEYSLAVGKARNTATTRVVNLFMAALGAGSGRISNADPYWDDSLRELLNHAIDLVSFATSKIVNGEARRSEAAPSLQQIQDVIRTAPQSLEQAKSKTFQESSGACASRLREADAIFCDVEFDQASELAGDLRDTFDYWTRSYPTLADRTRSVVVSSFTAKASGLLRAPLRSLFCGGTDYEATPESTYEGKVVLVNLPVKSFGDVGAFAQKLVKTVWQHATESDKRNVKEPCLPVFLWSDESQHFVTSEDVLYQATARSKLAATVYLTQNISNYYTQLGGAGSSATDALLASLQMKIFHSNGDPQTNEWAEKLFGDVLTDDATKNQNIAGGDLSFGKSIGNVVRPDIPARLFSLLTRGGGDELISSAYVYSAGKDWITSAGQSQPTFIYEDFKQTYVKETFNT